MTLTRLIPFRWHAVLQVLTGILTIAVALILGLSPIAAVVAVAAGALFVGLGLAGVPDEQGLLALAPTGARTAAAATALTLISAAGALALGGMGFDAVVLAAIGVAHLCVVVTTRYGVDA